MMKDLSKRVGVSTISISLVIALIFCSRIFWFQWIIAAVIGGLAGIAIWEYRQFAKVKGSRSASFPLVALGVMETVSFYTSQVFPEPSWKWPVWIFFGATLILTAIHFQETDGAILDLAVSSFGLLYIAVPMGMILSILFMNPSRAEDGRLWLAYLLVVTKIADIGGYFGGNLFGNRKLAPKISPGKTVEGAIAGLLCSLAASFCFSFLAGYFDSPGFSIDPYKALLLGTVLGLLGQFGDLAESLLKRDAKFKDSNHLPGLGGVLDMMDSLIFNSCFIFFYLFL